MPRRTVEQLLDIAEITELRTEYAHRYDESDLEGLLELFAPDARCDWDQAHGGSWIGLDEIREGYRGSMERDGFVPFSAMHVTTNGRVELEGADRARGRRLARACVPACATDSRRFRSGSDSGRRAAQNLLESAATPRVRPRRRRAATSAGRR